jgi:hypothetical protein
MSIGHWDQKYDLRDCDYKMRRRRIFIKRLIRDLFLWPQLFRPQDFLISQKTMEMVDAAVTNSLNWIFIRQGFWIDLIFLHKEIGPI